MGLPEGFINKLKSIGHSDEVLSNILQALKFFGPPVHSEEPPSLDCQKLIEKKKLISVEDFKQMTGDEWCEVEEGMFYYGQWIQTGRKDQPFQAYGKGYLLCKQQNIGISALWTKHEVPHGDVVAINQLGYYVTTPTRDGKPHGVKIVKPMNKPAFEQRFVNGELQNE